MRKCGQQTDPISRKVISHLHVGTGKRRARNHANGKRSTRISSLLVSLPHCCFQQPTFELVLTPLGEDILFFPSVVNDANF